MDFWHSLKVHCSGLKSGQRGSFLGLWLHQKPAWTQLGKGWPRQVHPLILHLQCLSLGSGHGRWNVHNIFPGPRKLCRTWGHREGWSVFFISWVSAPTVMFSCCPGSQFTMKRFMVNSRVTIRSRSHRVPGKALPWHHKPQLRCWRLESNFQKICRIFSRTVQ